LATSEKSFLDFPFRIGDDGKLQLTNISDHIKNEIIAVLLTSPGERVNLPEFGCELKDFVFAPNDAIITTMLDLKISQALDRWLGDKITVNEVNVQFIEEQLLIEIVYTIKSIFEQDVVSLSL